MDKFANKNRGNKYIFVAVCVLSKKLWAYPLKSKQYSDVEGAFDKLLADCPVTPARIFSDRGKEFFLNRKETHKDEKGKK
jgi:nitrogen fixation-related uncharacterized protein